MNHDCACGRPIQDTALICSPCSQDLAKALGDVPFLAEQLDIRLTRQARIGSGGKSAERALPYDPYASVIAAELHNALSTWVRVLAGTDGDPLLGSVCAAICGHGTCGRIRRQSPPADTLVSLSAWLLGRVGDLAHHEAAEEAKAGICDATDRAERAIDRIADRWYAGPCDNCECDLYAKPSAGWVICPCGAQYDVTARRTWLLAAAEDILASAALIARALPPLGHEVKVDRIYKWAERGNIVAKSVDLRGRPLYRIGDVLDVLGRLGSGRERATV